MKTLKAVKSSYIALGCPCFFLLLLYGYILFIQNKDVLQVFIGLIVVLSIIFIWLNGFRIVITDKSLSYRDGLYKTTVIKKAEIKLIKHTWVEFSRFRKDLKIPRLLIILKDGTHVLINDKPFGRDAMKELNKINQ